jgi:hypothetical protein
MPIRIAKRSLTIFLAADYLLVLLFGMAFHNHPFGEQRTCGAHADRCCQAPSDCPDKDGQSPGKGNRHCPTHEPCCPACRVLAANPLPACVVQASPSSPVDSDVQEASAECPTFFVAHAWQSRAPPAVA